MVADSLDTNLIVSYILGEPVAQYRKVADLLGTVAATHHVADLAITEAVYVFESHYKMPRDRIVANLKVFLDSFDNILNYNRALFDLVFPCYVEHPQLSFNDCCMAYYSELNHAEPLFTFDKQLAKKHASAKLLD